MCTNYDSAHDNNKQEAILGGSHALSKAETIFFFQFSYKFVAAEHSARVWKKEEKPKKV